MKFIKLIYIFLLLIVSCIDHESPFNPTDSGVINNTMPELGEVRDIFIDKEDSLVFIGTESKGIYIFKINNNLDLELLHSNEEWGIGKDIRGVHYSSDKEIIFALDRFGQLYHEYLPNIINGDVDSLISVDCGTATHATKFHVENIENSTPEVSILYKHNADNELYLENSYSEIKKLTYNFLFDFGNDVQVSQECQNNFENSDSLYYDVSDMHYEQGLFFLSNVDSTVYSSGIYSSIGVLNDLDTLEAKTLSIYSKNNLVFEGTKNNGCYITLLDGDGFSNDSDNKLHIAEQMTVLDIHYDSNHQKLLLSCASQGVLVYNWDGSTSLDGISESIRIYSSYAFTSKLFGDLMYVATKNGLEVFNIGE